MSISVGRQYFRARHHDRRVCAKHLRRDILAIFGLGRQIGDRLPDRLHVGEELTAGAPKFVSGDDRGLALVQAFLKAGMRTETGAISALNDFATVS